MYMYLTYKIEFEHHLSLKNVYMYVNYVTSRVETVHLRIIVIENIRLLCNVMCDSVMMRVY